jgi:hypothetical protein
MMRKDTDIFNTQISAVNKILDSIPGLKLANSGQLPFQLGTNTPNKGTDPTKFRDLFTPNETGTNAFSQLAFTYEGDDSVNAKLSGKSFVDPGELLATLADKKDPYSSPITQAIDTIKTKNAETAANQKIGEQAIADLLANPDYLASIGVGNRGGGDSGDSGGGEGGG